MACNTASTHALEAVTVLAAPVPVIGMIEPAAYAAVAATRNNHIGVIATAGQSSPVLMPVHLIVSHLTPRFCSAACQMLVALAEGAWTDQGDPVVRSILSRYLDPLFDHAHAPDTLILGCTHFPVFRILLPRYWAMV